nr:hypothetical protein [uncultured Mediterranean phage uvMED]
MESNQVTLDLYEMQSASHLGILRCLESKKHKENWGYNYKGSLNDQMAKSISGSMGEVALAKFLKIKFEYHCNVGGIPDLIFKDLRLQIRTQIPKNNNSLIIRPKAKPGELYILVIDKAPDFEILGFVNSTYVLGQEQWKTTFGLDRPFCYSIPPEKLTPINLLKDSSWN